MPSTRASDTDGEVRLALPRELREQEVEETLQLFLEGLHFGRLLQVIDHGLIVTGERL